jgi:transposase-like protein
MAKKITKAAAIMELLNNGVTGANICRRLNVSPGYVSMLKKQMAHRAEEEPQAEAVQETGVDAILNERGSRYGDFMGHARITQTLKDFAYLTLRNKQKTLAPDQQEALDMIFHKIGRILNGDPDYADSWIDIAGYAKLVADRLEGKVR